MARKKKKTTKKKKSFVLDERKKVVLGIFLIVAAIYLFLAFTGFLFTWQEDMSKSELKFTDFFNSNVLVANPMGKLGAALSVTFMYNWFGIGSYGIVIIMLLTGLKFLNFNIKNYGKIVLHTVIIMSWLTLFLALISKENGFLLGGSYGNMGYRILKSILGGFGTTIFLLIVLITYIFLTFESSYEWTKNKITGLSDKEKLSHLKEGLTIGNLIANVKNKMEKQPSDTEQEDEEPEDDILDSQELNPFNRITEKEPQTQAPRTNAGSTPVKKFVITDDGKTVENDGVEFEVDLSTLQNQDQQQAVQQQAQKLDDKLHDRLNLQVETAETIQVEEVLQDYDPIKSLPDYKFPPISLLNDYKAKIDKESLIRELKEKKKKIVEVLKNFKIDIVKINAQVGPTVTLYEIVPAPGIPISKIKRLEEDIAMNLAALGIRIIAPMPGRGTIGIEVPNENRAIVGFKEVLLSPEYHNDKFELPIALGKDTVNQPFVFDLAKTPHLLMAGSTGEGKSVAINVIINSILFKKHPALVKFVMIDPKQVELSLYSRLEYHYLATLPGAEEPIVTEVKDASRVLKSLIAEMEDRYRLLKLAQVRNIKEYNQKFIKRKIREKDGHRFMPYIVTVIDEFADLVMVGGKEIEHSITRLSQKARAIGIHLVIATQRPSTDVVTGLIKNNFPTRIALKVMSVGDSKTIIDTTGANQLIGKGDMLYLYGSNLRRLQCAFIDTEEVERVTEYIESQPKYPYRFELPEPAEDEEAAEEKANIDLKKRDKLFEDAAQIVVSNQYASISLLQRKLEIGFNRAARIIDQLEAAGIVGPGAGSKPRDVLVHSLDELDEIIARLS